MRRDTTVSVLGGTYELEQGFLAGRIVDVVYSHLDDPPRPEVEYEGKNYALSLVDPILNAQRARPPRRPETMASVPVRFDPSCTTATEDANDDEPQEDFDEIF